MQFKGNKINENKMYVCLWISIIIYICVWISTYSSKKWWIELQSITLLTNNKKKMEYYVLFDKIIIKYKNDVIIFHWFSAAFALHISISDRSAKNMHSFVYLNIISTIHIILIMFIKKVSLSSDI